jgi:DNA helicase IV
LKRHPSLHAALLERFERLKPVGTTLRRLRRRLAELFSDRAFLSSVVDRAHGNLPRSAVEQTVRHTMLQLADRASVLLADITDPQMKRTLDGQRIDLGTPEELAGTIDLEDLPILLFLKIWRGEVHSEPIAHLVLDEAEDFSPFELYVLGQQLSESRSVTLAGDEAQQTHSSFQSWRYSLETLGVSTATICRLATSYRCPRPVAELAQHVLGSLARDESLRAAREGADVGRFRFGSVSQAELFVFDAVSALRLAEENASIAVILNDTEAARHFHSLFREPRDARLVLDGAFSFEAGIDVTHVNAVKGLEFDYVVVPDASLLNYSDCDDARRRLHVAITRAAHQLWLVSGGAPSPLLDWA